jgi:universal stress protein E
MRRLRRILVAIKDPGAGSLRGVAKAAQLAKASGARLELFHGLTLPVYVEPFVPAEFAPARVLAREKSARRKQLERIAGRLRRRGVRTSVAVAADFPAHEAIIRRASKAGADLIVVEAHAGRRFMASILQLTDWELLRHSRVPVLIVKGARRYRRPVLLAAVDPMHAFAKPGRLDGEILAAAATLRAALGGKLHVLHAYRPLPLAAASENYLSPRIAAELMERTEAAARKSFARLLRDARLEASCGHLVAQEPFAAIKRLASTTHASIVVMGTISRSGIKRLLIGNTAERALNEIDCDILVVKPRGFTTGIGRARRGPRIVSNPMMLPF